ncbi:MAG: fibronectin type III domain-containing protein [Rhodoferax sp.]|nr:fibronectin type III domain-containing protein [Actinomycetota bacterium]
MNNATTVGAATLAWTPGFNGGSAITSYQIVATPTLVGTIVTRTGIAATATSGTITGLVNGTAYTLQVRAVNALGTGPLSAASNAVTPTGVPGAPTAVVGTRGNTTVALSWAAPIVDGGTAITGYTVQVRVAGTVVRTDVLTSAVTTATITGLTNGTAYTFRVFATNANGSGALSVASAAVTPASAPTVAPVLGTATLPPVSQGAVGSPLTATVNWTGVPVAGNGGSAITGYTATVRNNLGAVVQSVSTATAATRSVTFTFSVDPGPYTFEVLAFNTVGDGLASAPSAPILAR